MKKLIFAFVLIAAFSTADAQNNVSFGPNGGFGHTWISADGSHRYQTAANFGASLIYSANEHIGIGADLKYSKEGTKVVVANTTNTSQLNYLRVPIKAIFFFQEYGDRVRPKVSLGPSFGFLIGGKETIGTTERSSSDDYRGVDLGLLASAGMNVRMVSNVWLTIDMNYYHGLSDVSKFATTNRNRNLSLNLGVLFGIAHSND